MIIDKPSPLSAGGGREMNINMPINYPTLQTHRWAWSVGCGKQSQIVQWFLFAYSRHFWVEMS